MPHETKKLLSMNDFQMLDIVLTGEAARILGCDRRTFKSRAMKYNIKPIAILEGGKHAYRREDVERVVTLINLMSKD